MAVQSGERLQIRAHHLYTHRTQTLHANKILQKYILIPKITFKGSIWWALLDKNPTFNTEMLILMIYAAKP